MLRTGCGLMILVACGVAAAAADLELLPKGHPKERPAPVQPSAPPAPQPQAPAPAQKDTTPQRLQSPEPPVPPADKDKPLPGEDKRLDLQPPDSPAPTEGESWWQKIVRSAPECRTFSDGCRTCDVKFTCSSLPIACQPKEFVCTDPKSPGQ